MRADQDFTAYVAARWNAVVRMSVLLGLPPERAEGAAVAAFARLLPDWSRLAHEGDLEVELARAVLAEWARASPEAAVPRPVLVPPARFVTPEREEQLALLERLGDGLDRLDEPTRATVLLHHLGELDTGQLTEALREAPVEVRGRLAAGDAVVDLGREDGWRTAASAIEVGPAPLDRVVGRARAGRRRQWLLTGAVLVALVAAGGAAYVLNRPDAPERAEPLATLTLDPVENPVDLAWWSDDVLHLVHATAPLPDVRQLVEAGTGVVYGDADGNVVSVSDDGSRARLGTKDPDAPLTSSGSLGEVAWADADTGDLIVHDVYNQVDAGRLDAGGDKEPIGFDQGRLYYADDGTARSWSMEDPPRLQVSDVDFETDDGATRPTLVDVSSATQVRLDEGQMSVVQPFFNVSFPLPGFDAQLSPDGNFALAATAAGDPAPVVYDTRSGDPELSWFIDAWRPVTATFNHDGRVVWVVDEGEGALGIFACASSHAFVNSFDPDSEPCTPGADIGPDAPLLAGRLSR